MIIVNNKTDFPIPKNKNQQKLFYHLQQYCKKYKNSIQEEKTIWRNQSFGMIMLYIDLFPQEEKEIGDLWTNYFLKQLW